MTLSPIVRPALLCVGLATLGCASQTSKGAGAPKTGSEMTSYRKAVGGLGAGYLFQTHMAIGATADLLGHGVYTPSEVQAMMETTIGTGRNVDEIIDELRQTNLGPSDGQTLTRMDELNRLLGEQARALMEFAMDRTEERARHFYQLRDSTWQRLRQLLGIDRRTEDTPGLEEG